MEIRGKAIEKLQKANKTVATMHGMDKAISVINAMPQNATKAEIITTLKEVSGTVGTMHGLREAINIVSEL